MNKENITIRSSLSMTVGGHILSGENRIALLGAIQSCGSITKAAQSIGLSYKAAWDAIDAMNNLAGEPLAVRLTGGKGGGGTKLTERGVRLVQNYRLIEQEQQRLIAEFNKQSIDIMNDYVLVRRIAMKTSARNHFSGKIIALTAGAVNDEVVLETQRGQQIIAIITHESSVSLNLQIGSEAFALIKASSIILSTETAAKFSARNSFKGKVSRLHEGAVNTEVVLELDSGDILTTIITKASAQSLRLGEGTSATALFKASSVILGVPN